MPEIKTPRLAIGVTKTRPTYVKQYPSVSGNRFGDSFSFSRNDLPLLLTRMSTELNQSHYEIELAVPIEGRYNWFVFHEHVAEVEMPKFFLQASDNTVIKRRIADSTILSPEEKFNFNTSTQPLQAHFIRDADPKHFEISLIKPVNGIHNWFAFKEQVRASNVQVRTAV